MIAFAMKKPADGHPKRMSNEKTTTLTAQI